MSRSVSFRSAVVVTIQTAVIFGGFATIVRAAIPTPSGTGFPLVVDGGPQSTATFDTLATSVTDLAKGTSYPATSQVDPFTLTSSAFVTAFTLAPDAGVQWDCYPIIQTHGYEGLSDGGVSGTDAQAPGTIPTPNQAKIFDEFHVDVLNYQTDGAAGEQVLVHAPGATSTLGPISLTPVAIADQHDCTSSYGDTTNCVNDGTTGINAQVYVDAGVVTFQVRMSANAVGYPTLGAVLANCNARQP